jgi:23S rRNA pseudouridine955/2504/2580 synthase
MAQEIIVPAGQPEHTLETFLSKNFPAGYVRKLFRKHAVRINGRRARKADKVRPGDRVALFIPFEPAVSKPARSAVDIPLLFEDRELLVIDKPAGLAVHEAKNIPRGQTLIGALEARHRASGFKPQLVHRLDKETSGVLLLAKTEEAARLLESQFEEAATQKEYTSLVAGILARSSGIIDLPLPGRQGGPVRAVTRYRVASRFLDTTLVRVHMETGRMHQIRLHFAHLDHPVVMDRQHGDFGFNKTIRKRTGLKRQFLHAARLALSFRGKQFSWEAPLPDDLRRTLEILEKESRHGR